MKLRARFMYVLKPGIKQDPIKRWALPDRIFFGHGACHILAGAYLDLAPLPGFYAEWVKPADGYTGNHIYVTDGTVAFDYHGYTERDRLVAHHTKGWRRQFPGWHGECARVDFSLLNTVALNQRNMRGPDQYLGDPIARAQRFMNAVDHRAASNKARALAARSPQSP